MAKQIPHLAKIVYNGHFKRNLIEMYYINWLNQISIQGKLWVYS